MTIPLISRRRSAALSLTAALTAVLTLPTLAAPMMTRLTGHVPRTAISQARLLGRAAPQERVSLALALPLRNQGGLTELLRRLYTPGDPMSGQFLSSAEFTERFGPTAKDYNTVAAFARSRGLTITGTPANRLLLDVAGTTAQVESAFGVHLRRYQSRSGRVFRAPDADPAIPSGLAGRLSAVIGLDTATQRRPHLRPSLNPQAGTGQLGGLTPSDVKAAYSLTGVTATGAGQSIALFELDGYTPSDVTGYEAAYGLPAAPLQNILVDGATGVAGTNSDEVTLDIELAQALAPGISRILVYETPSATDTNYIDCYNRIATDNAAKQVSTSWGGPENQTAPSTLNSENAIFMQMAAQGQSIFAVSGDNGAYDDASTLSVDDPGSQPYVTSVGGTTLTTAGPGGGYASETAWGDPADTSFSPLGSGSGGGFSGFWPAPAYQQVLQPTPAKRSVPDVALDSDPNTGYSLLIGGQWHVYGGTSAAAPLWASFAALVNQTRAAQGLAPAGFLNPAIYGIGANASYGSDFHDVTTGNNLYYPAKTGYDNATGFGSFVGNALLNALAAPPGQAGPTAALTGTVTSTGGGPLPSATIRATVNGTVTGTATTVADGSYALTIPGGVTVTVVVDASTVPGPAYTNTLIGVTVPAGQSATESFVLHPAIVFPAGLQMVSAPFDFSGIGDFATLFGLAPPVRSPAPLLAQWQPASGSYAIYPNSPADTLRPGQGYWLNAPAGTYLHYDGVPVSTAQPFTIPLQTGWNQIGNPFIYAVPLARVTDSNGTPLASSAIVQPTLYRYDMGSRAYVALSPTTDALQPTGGYWVFARQATSLIVPPP